MSSTAGPTRDESARSAPAGSVPAESVPAESGFWWRAGLGLGGALLTQELSSQWGCHLPSTDLYPLSVAVGMTLYNAPLIRLRPPEDARSKMRALWLPAQKRQATLAMGALLVMSMIYVGSRVNRPVSSVTPEALQALRPVKEGWNTLSGSPRTQDERHYRWALLTGVTNIEDPHLTPLVEFNGQVLVLSAAPLTGKLESRRGWLTEVSPLMSPHYDSYRKYMGLAPNASIYLFDLRGVWWFDPYGFAAVTTALLLFLLTASSATRDPHNTSRRIYIPEDLRDHLDDESEPTSAEIQGQWEQMKSDYHASKPERAETGLNETLIDFYSGEGEDNRGRTLAEIIAWTDLKLEMTHDYIQWLFPLTEMSAHNCNAPILSAEDIRAFRDDDHLRAQVLTSFKRMLSFYGLALAEVSGSDELKLERASDFEAQARHWLTPHNHNHLRLTRIIKSLCLLGLPEYAQALLKALEVIYLTYDEIIGEVTLSYWREAAEPTAPLDVEASS